MGWLANYSVNMHGMVCKRSRECVRMHGLACELSRECACVSMHGLACKRSRETLECMDWLANYPMIMNMHGLLCK
jgi:hypothetical protein